MRIRKRQMSLSLLPVTHSDPNLISRSPVLVQLNGAATTSPKPSCTHVSATALMRLSDPAGPSDHPRRPIEKPTDGCDDRSGEGDASRRQHKKQECLVEDGGAGQKGNDSRKEVVSCSEIMPAKISLSSPSNSKQDGRWCEAEKAFPLKKRRGSFENVTKVNNNNNDNNSNKKKKKTRTKMKRKMSKKCSVQSDSDDEKEEEQEEEEEKAVVTKKRVRGGAIMEGSRCSRVNGRGWRCCQQTLVGYSLCEHHLGKGRLRSMTSVRNRSSAATTTTQGAAEPKKNHVQDHTPLSESSSSFPEKKTKCAGSESDEEEENEEKKSLMVTKNRMKLGMVKARSISSLLGQRQTNQP